MTPLRTGSLSTDYFGKEIVDLHLSSPSVPCKKFQFDSTSQLGFYFPYSLLILIYYLQKSGPLFY